MDDDRTYTAFAGHHRLVRGDLRALLRATKAHLDANANAPVLIFDDQTGAQVDFDFRGSLEEVLDRALPPKPRTGPGRPKLGVVCREVSLLPRHWEWLERQPQGISAGLRRLVDDARKNEPGKEKARLAREATGKFMWAMAGNLENFEEASRALYARDAARFAALIAGWPADVRDHVHGLAADGWWSDDSAPPQ